MKYHFIAIGGSAMHNLAIALHKRGEIVTGSDDEIFEPSRSRLKKYGLLPKKEGWYPEKLDKEVDVVVLGMHAREDNPELLKAQDMGITIYSYPEFLYNQTQLKKRAVIGGSHGKTTTTAMIMHVLRQSKKAFDYMVGAQIEGFETMVGFDRDAKISVFEGDEYLTSPIDRRPKFHLYHPDIALITGIAWDHINVFPTFDNYLEQFSIFIDKIEKGGSLIYFEGDENIKSIIQKKSLQDIEMIPYTTHPNRVIDGKTYLLHEGKEILIKIFGEHNMQNLSGAKQVCLQLGVSEEQFYLSIQTFEGAAKRLQLLGENDNLKIFQDFAHSPSKLKATIDSVKKQFIGKRIIAVMELHTFSSLNRDFLQQYRDTMKEADVAYIYYSEHAVRQKKMQLISSEIIKNSFNKQGLKVITEKKELVNELFFMELKDSVLLLLSSGNFDGVQLNDLASKLLEKAM